MSRTSGTGNSMDPTSLISLFDNVSRRLHARFFRPTVSGIPDSNTVPCFLLRGIQYLLDTDTPLQWSAYPAAYSVLVSQLDLPALPQFSIRPFCFLIQ